VIPTLFFSYFWRAHAWASESVRSTGKNKALLKKCEVAALGFPLLINIYTGEGHRGGGGQAKSDRDRGRGGGIKGEKMEQGGGGIGAHCGILIYPLCVSKTFTQSCVQGFM
jgi:hypothetical protein